MDAMMLQNPAALGGLVLLTVILLAAFLAILFRVVVSTNDVDIVQSARRTVSYGKDQPSGNTYYRWPSWVPVIGVKTIRLPVSVFDVQLNDYAGYDKGRVPFIIDVMAFFRVEDPLTAAQRVHSVEHLRGQLLGILQGATRSILAKAEIEEILEERAKFGIAFTEAVNAQLKAWGVTNVKNIELMDIRDSTASKVIQNIMAKKQSLIERDSRMTVAENLRAASEAEIVAKRQVELAQQEAEQQVGQRTAQKEREVGIAQQEAEQQVLAQQRETVTRDMAVKEVEKVRAAEIERAAQVVSFDQERQQAVIHAQGQLDAAKLHAQGVEIEGRAQGEAEKAVLLAPVTAQLTLAEKIGENKNYQEYLIGIRAIEKDQVVGIAQAEALKDADLKVIANAGDVVSGVGGLMGLLTPKAGTQLGAMVEAFAQTPAGAKVIERLTVPKE